jgi:hypothetical protein
MEIAPIWINLMPGICWSLEGICFTHKGRAASLQPLTFSNHCSNAVFSNASPGLTFYFLGVNIGVF